MDKRMRSSNSPTPSDAAVLVVRPFQTFRFVRPPFRLSLAGRRIAASRPARKCAPPSASPSAIRRSTPPSLCGQRDNPSIELRLYLPDGFTLERLGPGDLEWSITTENDRQLLTVQLLDGRTGGVHADAVRQDRHGPISRSKKPRLSPPKIEVLDVEKQEGEIAVLPDPDTDVRLDDLRNCESSPVMTAACLVESRAAGARQSVASLSHGRLLRNADAHCRAPPLVSVRTITNVKVTPRSIEETLLLNFQIEQAGIRRVVFLVPQHLAKARLKARLLKQKTVEPATSRGRSADRRAWFA